jgi:hypothetical protein
MEMKMSKRQHTLADAIAASETSNETFGPALSATAEANRCAVTIRLSHEQRQQLKLKSITHNTTMQEVLMEAIEMYIKSPYEASKR